MLELGGPHTHRWSLGEKGGKVLAGSSTPQEPTLPKNYIPVRQEARARVRKDSKGFWPRLGSSELFFLCPMSQGLERNRLYSKDFWGLWHQRLKSQTSTLRLVRE